MYIGIMLAVALLLSIPPLVILLRGQHRALKLQETFRTLDLLFLQEDLCKQRGKWEGTPVKRRWEVQKAAAEADLRTLLNPSKSLHV